MIGIWWNWQPYNQLCHYILTAHLIELDTFRWIYVAHVARITAEAWASFIATIALLSTLLRATKFRSLNDQTSEPFDWTGSGPEYTR